jgi:predicted PurR-regulated permease PerM
VLVLAIVIVLGAVVLVVVQAIVDAVREFSDDLPQIVDEVRRSDLGGFTNGGSDSLDILVRHTNEITSGVAKVSGGVADVGLSAFGAVTLFFLVIFLPLFGLMDEARMRDWIGRLLYRASASASCRSPIGSSRPRRATCSATWRFPSSAELSTESPQSSSTFRTRSLWR